MLILTPHLALYFLPQGPQLCSTAAEAFDGKVSRLSERCTLRFELVLTLVISISVVKPDFEVLKTLKMLIRSGCLG